MSIIRPIPFWPSFDPWAKETPVQVKQKSSGYQVFGDPRPLVANYISRHDLNEGTYPALSKLIEEISEQIRGYDTIAQIPFAAVGNTRNDIYLASEAIRFLEKDKNSELSDVEKKALKAYKTEIDKATKFIPTAILTHVGINFVALSISVL